VNRKAGDDEVEAGIGKRQGAIVAMIPLTIATMPKITSA
jgi:hypothetical protein